MSNTGATRSLTEQFNHLRQMNLVSTSSGFSRLAEVSLDIKTPDEPMWCISYDNISAILDKQDECIKQRRNICKDLLNESSKPYVNQKQVDSLLEKLNKNREAFDLRSLEIKKLLPDIINRKVSSGKDDVVRKNIQISLANRIREQGLELRKIDAQMRPVDSKQDETNQIETKQDLELAQIGNNQIETKQDLELNKMRYEQIIGLASSVSTLSQITNELNGMVIDQGTIIDRIDHNIDMAIPKIQQGNTELKQATKRQGTCKCKFIAILCLVLLVETIILAVKHI